MRKFNLANAAKRDAEIGFEVLPAIGSAEVGHRLHLGGIGARRGSAQGRSGRLVSHRVSSMSCRQPESRRRFRAASMRSKFHA